MSILPLGKEPAFWQRNLSALLEELFMQLLYWKLFGQISLAIGY